MLFSKLMYQSIMGPGVAVPDAGRHPGPDHTPHAPSELLSGVPTDSPILIGYDALLCLGVAAADAGRHPGPNHAPMERIAHVEDVT